MRIGLPGVTSIYSSRKSKERLYHSADAQGSSAWGGVESSVTTELRGANRTSKRKFKAGQGQRMQLQDLNPR